jgi:hypothetical protein
MRAVLAAFAASDDGVAYRATCERYRVDPGAIFDDDVEAYLMRQSLMLAERASGEPQITDVEREWASVV